MTQYSTTKAIATARELIDLFTKELTTMTNVVESYDSSGNPVITAYNTNSAGNKVVVIQVQPIAWTAVDILGLASNVYCPHQINICTEATSSSSSGIVGFLTPVELLPILSEIAKRGMLVNWYQSHQGTVPALAQITAANLVASFGDLYWSAQKAQ
jgi:hypothetical protein